MAVSTPMACSRFSPSAEPWQSSTSSNVAAVMSAASMHCLQIVRSGLIVVFRYAEFTFSVALATSTPSPMEDMKQFTNSTRCPASGALLSTHAW